MSQILHLPEAECTVFVLKLCLGHVGDSCVRGTNLLPRKDTLASVFTVGKQFVKQKHLHTTFLNSISSTVLAVILGLRPAFSKAALCILKCMPSHCSVTRLRFRKLFCSCLSWWFSRWFEGIVPTSLLQRESYYFCL